MNSIARPWHSCKASTMTESTRRRYDVGGVLMDRPFEIDRLGHLGLYCEDIDAAGAFYRKHLGLRHTDVLDGDAQHPGPKGYFYSHNTDHHSMAMITAALARSRGPLFDRGITINQLSFQVGTLQEVVEGCEMLREHGVSISRVGRDRPGSNWAAYFQDPDGHTIELFYGMEQIGWDGRSKPKQAFSYLRRLEAPDLPQASETEEVSQQEGRGLRLTDGHLGRDEVGGTHNVGGILLPRPFRVTDMGPVGIYCADIEASLRFYTELLGLQATEEVHWQGTRSLYLRVANEHHSLALHSLDLRQKLGLPDRTTLMQHSFKVGSWKQLRDAVAYLEGEGMQRVGLPPQLHPGITYAAHFMGPEGHVIRLFHEMESVDRQGCPARAQDRAAPLEPWPEMLEHRPNGVARPAFLGPLG